MYTILCVDDDPKTLRALTRTLRSDDHEVVTFESAEKGLDYLSRDSAQLVISDFKMPGMNGGQFLGTVKTKYPSTIRIMLTGSMNTKSAMDSVGPGVVHKFIAKPSSVKELRSTVKWALEQWENNTNNNSSD